MELFILLIACLIQMKIMILYLKRRSGRSDNHDARPGLEHDDEKVKDDIDRLFLEKDINQSFKKGRKGTICLKI